MAPTIRTYRLWRTSAILCSLGAVEFAYVWLQRREGWLFIPIALLVVVAGLALRKARGSRETS